MFVLARVVDHPVRLWRLKCGLSQVELAGLAGVVRSAVTAVEDGRTKKPDDRILGVLASRLGVGVGVLRGEVEAWVGRPLVVDVKPSVRALMEVPPYVLSQYYRSFRQWRLEVAASPTAFASLLRVNPAVVSRWEAGELDRFPEALSRKLVEAFGRFGLSPEYVVELEKLPANG